MTSQSVKNTGLLRRETKARIIEEGQACTRNARSSQETVGLCEPKIMICGIAESSVLNALASIASFYLYIGTSTLDLRQPVAQLGQPGQVTHEKALLRIMSKRAVLLAMLK